MAVLSMMKTLASSECPQSPAGAMGNAGPQTGKPDGRVSLGLQDAQGAPGPGRRQEQERVVACVAHPWGACCSPRPAPGKLIPGMVSRGAWS